MAENNSIVLGQGSYGCVIKPSPPCEKPIITFRTDNPKNVVAKIYTSLSSTLQTAIKKEVEIGKILAKIDKNNEYYAIPIQLCKTSKNTLNTYKAFKKCEDIQSTIQEFEMLTMEDEGLDMLEVVTRYKHKYNALLPSKYWILLIKNILQGIELLNNNDIIHQDIKLPNIAYQNNRLKLLDFGLAIDFNNVYTLNNNRLTYYYFIHPFEYILISDYLKYKTYKKYTKSVLLQIFKNSWYEYLNDYGYKSYLSYKFFIPETDINTECDKMILKYISDPTAWFNDIQKYKNKIDIYAFGMTCVDIHLYLDYSDLTNIEKDKYIYFVKKIIEINPSKRFTVKEALKYYETVL